MKAIILAAGQGTRLKKYTRDLPKGMLEFHGQTLIERLVETLRECGIDRISVVRGYRGDRITCTGVRYFENPIWRNTNMVESLMCARSEFDDDTIVAYADVCVTPGLLRAVRDCPDRIAVAVDVDWRAYWQRRYGRVDADTESLRLDHDGYVVSLGRPNPPLEQIDGRYVGVLKFSQAALEQVVAIYEEVKATDWDRPWQQSSRPFRQAYMTDLLAELLDRGEKVTAVRVRGGWLEFDTDEDYERQRDWVLV